MLFINVKFAYKTGHTGVIQIYTPPINTGSHIHVILVNPAVTLGIPVRNV